MAQVATALAIAFAAVLVPAAPASADTVRELQWHLDNVHAPQAQQISRGDGVVVAVIDSGVDTGHPDLAGAVLPGRSFAGDADPNNDPTGHGTAMAGLIAARGGGPNNALGIAPGAQILPVKVPAEAVFSIADAIRYAADSGARVINLSFGRDAAGGSPPDEAQAIAYALSKDVVVVTSAGNIPGQASGNSFAMIPGVIAVGGTTRDSNHFDGSTAGAFVAVSGPAADVVSTFPRSVISTGFGSGAGSSNASAIVAGVAALIRSRYPELDAANVVNRILASSVDRGAPGRDPQFGFGTVDAERALTMDIAAVTENPLGVPPAGGPGPTDVQQLPDGDSGTARAVVLIGLLVGTLLCLGLFIGLIVWLVRRSNRRPPPGGPPYPGGGQPQPYRPQPATYPQQQPPPQYPPQQYPPQQSPPQYGQPPR